MADDETRTIDNAYFHTGNGGLSLDIVEQCSEEFGATYYLKVSFDHTGAGIAVTFPLGSLEVVGWLAHAMTDLLGRMAKEKDEGRHVAFEYCKEGQTSIQNGKALDKSIVFRWVPGKGFRILGTDLAWSDREVYE